MQMKPHKLTLLDPKSIIGFLITFELVCKTNGVHEGAAMWPSQIFVNQTSFAVLNACLSTGGTGKKTTWSASSKTRYFTTFTQVVNFLLEKDATDEVILDAKAEITHFVQPSYMTLI